MNKDTLNPPMYFSYWQFFVFDAAETIPGGIWTDRHDVQGFARRESTVCIGTMLQFGSADVHWAPRGYQDLPDYSRVIEVPLYCPTGRVVIEGPEEMNSGREVRVCPGHYSLTVAQRVIDDQREDVYLNLNMVPAPLRQSRILVADEGLSNVDDLLETAEPA